MHKFDLVKVQELSTSSLTLIIMSIVAHVATFLFILNALASYAFPVFLARMPFL